MSYNEFAQAVKSAKTPVIIVAEQETTAVEVALYDAGDNVSIVSNVLDMPISPLTGEMMEKPTGQTRRVPVETWLDQGNVIISQCDGCGVFHAVNPELADALEEMSVHACMICGTDNTVVFDAAKKKKAAKSDDHDDDDDDDDDDDEVEDKKEEKKEEKKEDDKKEEKKEEKKDDKKEEKKDDAKKSTSLDVQYAINLVDARNIDLLQRDDDVYYVMSDESPVGTIRRDLAYDDVRPLFADPDLLHTALVEAVKVGSKDVGRRFGYRAAQLPVDIETAASRHVRQAKRDAKNQVADQLANMKDRFRQSISIAMAGINRNLWNTENPIRTELLKTLSGIGVRQPDDVVNRAMENASDKFIEAVMTVAMEYYDKDDIARNEAASLISTAGYKHPAESVPHLHVVDVEDSAVAASVGQNTLQHFQAKISGIRRSK